VVFVGRVAPNKRQDRLVEAFAELRGMIDARLVLAGTIGGEDDAYANHVRARVRELGLSDDVFITGQCSTGQVHAIYRTAHVFLSFSEHEGFCVPLVEAMWFDIPVVALAASAVPETVGEAGVTFPWSEADRIVASRVYRVLTDAAARTASSSGNGDAA
jgi:glycosyltransferase involved in cell wall biosynthesis